jgi:hypothetical protein
MLLPRGAPFSTTGCAFDAVRLYKVMIFSEYFRQWVFQVAANKSDLMVLFLFSIRINKGDKIKIFNAPGR